MADMSEITDLAFYATAHAETTQSSDIQAEETGSGIKTLTDPPTHVGCEGEIVLVIGEEDSMIYTYHDGVWVRFRSYDSEY